jgi:uncharacterized membrane protein
VWNILFKGLTAILPVGITIYLVYWLGVSIEKVLRPLILFVIPENYYWPGMGLVVGLVLLFFVGLAVNAWIVQRLIRMGERLLKRIPLVKSIYSALSDFMEYFSATRQQKDLKNVVLVTFNEARWIGFLTNEKVNEIPALAGSEGLVSVYLPMSYQIGGYTIYVPNSHVERIDMSVEDAMRLVLTAGLSKHKTS